MHVVFDMILVAVFGFFVFRGWWRGFAEGGLKSGRWILSLVITLSLGPAFSAFIDRVWIHPPVYEKIHARFMDMADAANGQVDVWLSRIPAVFRPFLDMDSAEHKQDLNRLADEWAQDAADGLSGMISSIIGYILLFVLAYVVLTLAILFLRNLTKLPVVGTLDRMLGLALGIISGLLTTLLVAIILTAVLLISGNGAILDQSFLLKALSSLVIGL